MGIDQEHRQRLLAQLDKHTITAQEAEKFGIGGSGYGFSKPSRPANITNRTTGVYGGATVESGHKYGAVLNKNN